MMLPTLVSYLLFVSVLCEVWCGGTVILTDKNKNCR